jgi:hypothetical protein
MGLSSGARLAGAAVMFGSATWCWLGRALDLVYLRRSRRTMRPKTVLGTRQRLESWEVGGLPCAPCGSLSRRATVERGGDGDGEGGEEVGREVWGDEDREPMGLLFEVGDWMFGTPTSNTGR